MILVTGASGFVGAELVKKLASDKSIDGVVASSRNSCISWPRGVVHTQIASISSETDWSLALHGVDRVVHCAARVHVMSDDKKQSLKLFRRVNVDGTLNLARQAAEAGVSRFVFVSSIKVNGEVTQPGKPFRADDEPRPSDDYALSKLEAEQGLLHITKKTKMELVIVRSPLVYGPGVKANFASLMKFIQLGLPMPLGSINNSRSLVALSNLVDLLSICLKHPAAANQIFLASDGEDVSTTELLYRLGKAMNKKVNLMPIPVTIIDLVAKIFRKTSVSNRLCSSLQVDIEKTRSLLSWNPPLTLNQGLKKILEDAHK